MCEDTRVQRWLKRTAGACRSDESMIPKSVQQFSEKIMLKQKAKAG